MAKIKPLAGLPVKPINTKEKRKPKTRLSQVVVLHISFRVEEGQSPGFLKLSEPIIPETLYQAHHKQTYKRFHRPTVQEFCKPYPCSSFSVPSVRIPVEAAL